MSPRGLSPILRFLKPHLTLLAEFRDEAKERGFVVVVDMRKGTTWSGWVKPVLKCLHECFPGVVADVFIIKPEKFWEKHKTSASSGKYKFEVHMISADSLTKHIDLGQIPREMGGALSHDHDEWLDLRVDIEKLVWRMTECVRLFDSYTGAMQNGETPVDVPTAQEAIAEHQHLLNLISSVPFGNLEADLQHLRRRVFPAEAAAANGFVVGYPFSSPSSISSSEHAAGTMNGGMLPNPDLACSFPHLGQLIKRVLQQRTEITQLWDRRKRELDHCCQEKLFEQDAENVGLTVWDGCNTVLISTV